MKRTVVLITLAALFCMISSCSSEADEVGSMAEALVAAVEKKTNEGNFLAANRIDLLR